MTERGLRTSSRQSRPPLRFQENSDEDDEEDSEAANDDQQPKRVTRLQEASPTSTASQPSTSRGLRLLLLVVIYICFSVKIFNLFYYY